VVREELVVPEQFDVKHARETSVDQPFQQSAPEDQIKGRKMVDVGQTRRRAKATVSAGCPPIPHDISGILQSMI